MGLFEREREAQLDAFLENALPEDEVIFTFGSIKEQTGQVIRKDPGTSMPLMVSYKEMKDGLWINKEDIDLIENFSVGDRVIFNQSVESRVVDGAFYGIITSIGDYKNPMVTVEIYDENKIKIKDPTWVSILYFESKRIIKFDWKDKEEELTTSDDGTEPCEDVKLDSRTAEDFPGVYKFRLEQRRSETLPSSAFRILSINSQSKRRECGEITISNIQTGRQSSWFFRKDSNRANFDNLLIEVEVVEKEVEVEKIVETKVEVLPVGTPVIRGPHFSGNLDKIDNYETQGEIMYVSSNGKKYTVGWQNGQEDSYEYSNNTQEIIPGLAKPYEKYLEELESHNEKENKEPQSFGLFKTIDL